MSTIEPGDLAVIVGCGCEHSESAIGLVVEILAVMDAVTFCQTCQVTIPPARCAEILYHGTSAWLPLTWLRKIDPLAEPETEAEAVRVGLDCDATETGVPVPNI
jgi:hypothetical protein